MSNIFEDINLTCATCLKNKRCEILMNTKSEIFNLQCEGLQCKFNIEHQNNHPIVSITKPRNKLKPLLEKRIKCLKKECFYIKCFLSSYVSVIVNMRTEIKCGTGTITAINGRNI